MIDHKTALGKAYGPNLLRWILAMVRRLLIAWCAWAAVCLVASIAHATVTVDRVPGGFAEAGDYGMARADGWAAASGGSARQVFSTADEDEYLEVLALIELPEPIPENASADPGGTMLASAGTMLGQTDPPPDATARFDDDGNLAVITGRWEDSESGETYFVAMASGGPTHGVVVLAVRTEEALIYERGFDDVVAGITGTAPPIARFNIKKWRITGLIGWILFTALAWVVVWRLGEGQSTAGEQSRRVAATCTIAAFVVLVVAYVVLGGKDVELSLAELSREWAAAEVFLFGVAAAGIALVIGTIRSAQVKPVQSAPDGGAFGRLRNQAVRGVAKPAEVVPAGVDGPSTLSPADETEPGDPDPPEGKVISIVGGEEFPPPTEPGGPPEL